MSTMSTTIASTPKRSWAQVVKGNEAVDDQTSPQHFKPGARGSLLCRCRGELLTMLSHYGWIMVYGNIDHPSAEKHQGHVYVSKEDLVDGTAPVPGDIVSFYLYTDEKGLGAEECSVEHDSNSDAINFAPMATEPFDEKIVNHDVQELAPDMAQNHEAVFESVMSNATLEDAQANDSVRVKGFQEVFFRLSQIFALAGAEEEGLPPIIEEDAESSCNETDVESCPARTLRIASKGKRASSPDGSTSAGSSSDSESEGSCHELPLITRMPPLGTTDISVNIRC